MNEMKCPVCHDLLFATRTFTTPCGHVFCESCLLLSLRAPRCPICNRATTFQECTRLCLEVPVPPCPERQIAVRRMKFKDAAVLLRAASFSTAAANAIDKNEVATILLAVKYACGGHIMSPEIEQAPRERPMGSFFAGTCHNICPDQSCVASAEHDSDIKACLSMGICNLSAVSNCFRLELVKHGAISLLANLAACCGDDINDVVVLKAISQMIFHTPSLAVDFEADGIVAILLDLLTRCKTQDMQFSVLEALLLIASNIEHIRNAAEKLVQIAKNGCEKRTSNRTMNQSSLLPYFLINSGTTGVVSTRTLAQFAGRRDMSFAYIQLSVLVILHTVTADTPQSRERCGTVRAELLQAGCANLFFSMLESRHTIVRNGALIALKRFVTDPVALSPLARAGIIQALIRIANPQSMNHIARISASQLLATLAIKSAEQQHSRRLGNTALAEAGTEAEDHSLYAPSVFVSAAPSWAFVIEESTLRITESARVECALALSYMANAHHGLCQYVTDRVLKYIATLINPGGGCARTRTIAIQVLWHFCTATPHQVANAFMATNVLHGLLQFMKASPMHAVAAHATKTLEVMLTFIESPMLLYKLISEQAATALVPVLANRSAADSAVIILKKMLMERTGGNEPRQCSSFRTSILLDIEGAVSAVINLAIGAAGPVATFSEPARHGAILLIRAISTSPLGVAAITRTGRVPEFAKLLENAPIDSQVSVTAALMFLCKESQVCRREVSGAAMRVIFNLAVSRCDNVSLHVGVVHLLASLVANSFERSMAITCDDFPLLVALLDSNNVLVRFSAMRAVITVIFMYCFASAMNQNEPVISNACSFFDVDTPNIAHVVDQFITDLAANRDWRAEMMQLNGGKEPAPAVAALVLLRKAMRDVNINSIIQTLVSFLAESENMQTQTEENSGEVAKESTSVSWQHAFCLVQHQGVDIALCRAQAVVVFGLLAMQHNAPYLTKQICCHTPDAVKCLVHCGLRHIGQSNQRERHSAIISLAQLARHGDDADKRVIAHELVSCAGSLHDLQNMASKPQANQLYAAAFATLASVASAAVPATVSFSKNRKRKLMP